MKMQLGIYLMLQRVSIFDFSTLESMYCGNAVILSKIPGNIEYSRDENILLLDNKTSDDEIRAFIQKIDEIRRKNIVVYKDYFLVIILNIDI